jgi:hypothetical protein
MKLKLVKQFVPANHGVGGQHGRVWWGWHVVNAADAMLTGAMPLLKAAATLRRMRNARICRICDGGPGNNGVCLCGERAWS